MGTLMFLKDDDEIRRQLEELVTHDQRFGFDEQNNVFIRSITAEEIAELVKQGARLGGIFSQEYASRKDVQTVMLDVVNHNDVHTIAPAPVAFEDFKFRIRSYGESLVPLGGMIHWRVKEILKPVNKLRSDSFFYRHRGVN